MCGWALLLVESSPPSGMENEGEDGEECRRWAPSHPHLTEYPSHGPASRINSYHRINPSLSTISPQKKRGLNTRKNLLRFIQLTLDVFSQVCKIKSVKLGVNWIRASWSLFIFAQKETHFQEWVLVRKIKIYQFEYNSISVLHYSILQFISVIHSFC